MSVSSTQEGVKLNMNQNKKKIEFVEFNSR